VFHQDIQTPRHKSKKRGAAEFFNNRLRGVWIPDETFLRVFKMASQTIHSHWRNSKQKFAKFYANIDPVSKPPSGGSDFLCFLFMNY